MKRNQVRKGLIIVVETELFGNYVGSITKIVSKPGEVEDRSFQATGMKTTKELEAQMSVMCEPTTVPHTALRFNNKPVCFERIENIRLATEPEKELYREGQ